MSAASTLDLFRTAEFLDDIVMDQDSLAQTLLPDPFIVTVNAPVLIERDRTGENAMAYGSPPAEMAGIHGIDHQVWKC
jgi:hypothetical protein